MCNDINLEHVNVPFILSLPSLTEEKIIVFLLTSCLLRKACAFSSKLVIRISLTYFSLQINRKFEQTSNRTETSSYSSRIEISQDDIFFSYFFFLRNYLKIIWGLLFKFPQLHMRKELQNEISSLYEEG